MTPVRRSRILVVDDDGDLVKALSLFLEHLGHDAVVSQRVHDAMKIVEDSSEHFSFAFIDHQMGVPSGADLAAWLLRRLPGVGIIVMSGFPVDLDELLCEVGIEDRGNRLTFLQKPFRPADVAASLEQLVLTSDSEG